MPLIVRSLMYLCVMGVLAFVLCFGAVSALAQSSGDPSFDYDDEIAAAKASGSTYTVDYLETCRDTPAGGVLFVPPSMEDTILDLCKVRDFDVRVSSVVWRPTIGRKPASGRTQSKEAPAQGSRGAVCRAAAAKRITHCEVQITYCGGSLDCEKVTCDTNFTGCNDVWSGGPFDYYCDTGNSWNRDAHYDSVLAKACPGQ